MRRKDGNLSHAVGQTETDNAPAPSPINIVKMQNDGQEESARHASVDT